jgi:hypothetical protein
MPAASPPTSIAARVRTLAARRSEPLNGAVESRYGRVERMSAEGDSGGRLRVTTGSVPIEGF